MYTIKRIDFTDNETIRLFPEQYETENETYENMAAFADYECDEWTDKTDGMNFYPEERYEDKAIDILYYYYARPNDIRTLVTYIVVEVD